MRGGRNGTAVPPSFYGTLKIKGRSLLLGMIFLFSGMVQALFLCKLFQLTAHGQLNRLAEKISHSLLISPHPFRCKYIVYHLCIGLIVGRGVLIAPIPQAGMPPLARRICSSAVIMIHFGSSADRSRCSMSVNRWPGTKSMFRLICSRQGVRPGSGRLTRAASWNFNSPPGSICRRNSGAEILPVW